MGGYECHKFLDAEKNAENPIPKVVIAQIGGEIEGRVSIARQVKMSIPTEREALGERRKS